MAFDPNNLFHEMVQIFSNNYSKENQVVICNEGGSRCFSKGTKVFTNKGYKAIHSINKGEKVLTFNEYTKQKEFKTVNETLSFNNTKRTIEVTLKNGNTFTATEDHEFYYEGAWHTLKHLLSLHDGNKRDLEENRRFFKV